MRRYVERWGVGLLATLTLLGMGLLYTNPTLLAGALIPLVYLFYGTLSRVPGDTRLSVSRSLTPSTPEPGQPVQVRLQVRNEGESVLPDVRIIDGVPPELAVTEGSARLSLPLSPGETATVSYTLIAKRGEFVFDDPAVRLRSLSGSERVTRTITPEGNGGFTCTNSTSDTPLQRSEIMRRGTLAVDEGGPGQEFYATRQYKRGDPVNRIDWHHVAKTGEFITIQYREQRAAKTVLVVDARPLNRVTPGAGYPTGAQLSAYAGERLFDSMDSAGVAASVAAIGFEAGELDGLVGPDGFAWVDPEQRTGRQSRASLLFHRLQTAAAEDVGGLSLALPESLFVGGGVAGGSATAVPTAGVGSGDSQGQVAGSGDGVSARADGGGGDGGPADRGGSGLDEEIHRLLTRIPEDAQVVLCSPLLDNWPVTLASALTVRGYSVLALSPDAVGAGTPGQRLAGVSRRARLRAIDRMGAGTVDWSIDSPISYAVRRSLPHLLTE